MENQESASFYLLSNTATSSTIGNDLKFNNFNMAECLGDLYYKYDKFKIVLNSVSFYNGNQANKLVSIKMSGLDFIGVYDFGTKSKTTATLGVVTAVGAGTINNITPSNWGCVFTKPSSPTVNLNIVYFDIKLNSIDSTANYGLNNLTFSIYGIN